MNKRDPIFDEVDKPLQDITKSDFKYSKNLHQWCINYNAPYSMGPHGICIDADQFEDEEFFTNDRIRLILQDKINKAIENKFNELRTGIKNESFKEYLNRSTLTPRKY